MLQQTTVGAVERRYSAFLGRFPTVQDLARTRLEDVLAAWSGLGYYRRARDLHAAARIIVARHGGLLPDDEGKLSKLPGVGKYMAAALAAIAFGRRAFPVEANIRRVVSRLFATSDPASALSPLISPRHPGESIAALFDLGQSLCRPRNPDCDACPLAGQCAARARCEISLFPPPARRPAPRAVHLAVAAVERGGRYFFRRRVSPWLGGMWEMPTGEGDTPIAARRALTRVVSGIARRPIGTARHAIVGRDLRITLYRGREIADEAGGKWWTPGRAGRAALPTLTRKILALLAPDRRKIPQ
jgi:A/G-specific adenine glycosylase